MLCNHFSKLLSQLIVAGVLIGYLMPLVTLAMR
jgi:hypothetical protein